LTETEQSAAKLSMILHIFAELRYTVTVTLTSDSMTLNVSGILERSRITCGWVDVLTFHPTCNWKLGEGLGERLCRVFKLDLGSSLWYTIYSTSLNHFWNTHRQFPIWVQILVALLTRFMRFLSKKRHY